MYGVVYTTGGVSALGTCRTVEGMLTDHTAQFTAIHVPGMVTYVSAYGTNAVDTRALVHTGVATLYARASVPLVLTGQTAVDTRSVREVVIVARLAADRTYAVGVAVIAGSAALRAVAVRPLVITFGGGSTVDIVELEARTELAKVCVAIKIYLFEVRVDSHPIAAVSYGSLVGSAEMLADEFREGGLVAHLVAIVIVCQ